MMCASRRLAELAWAAAIVLIVGSSVWVGRAEAQLYSALHRPVPAGYYTFQTPHFQLIYQDRLFAEALETSALLERVYPEVRAAVGLRRALDVPVILNHYTDRANGFVSPWPFRQEIEAVNLRGKALSPRFPTWLETVAPHELAHAAHAESGHGFGVGWILRKIGPDMARSLNLSGPSGMNEGVAVWLESRLHPGAGRLNYSLFQMQFRAAMASGDPWSLAQMLEPPAYTRPFDRYYNGGGHLFEYLVEKQGIEFFHRTRNFYYRFPLFGYASALWYGTRMMPHKLGRQLRAHYDEAGRDFVQGLGTLTSPETIATKKGAAYRMPRWLDDRTLVAYASGYDLRPGFYRIDSETGTHEAIAHEGITEDFYFSLSRDRNRLYYSRYVPATFAPGRSIAEVFRLDVASGEATRLTEGARAYGAVEREGEVWVLGNLRQFNEWRRVDGRREEGEGRRAVERGEVVGRLERAAIVAIVPSSSAERIALVANFEGRQGIFEAVMEDGVLVEVRPWVIPADASVFDASWSPDGAYVVFSADPGGVANIYAYEVEAGRVAKLTNVAFGAIEPSVSPDGEWLAYVNYQHERYELVRIPFTPENGAGAAVVGDAAALGLSGSGSATVPTIDRDVDGRVPEISGGEAAPRLDGGEAAPELGGGRRMATVRRTGGEDEGAADEEWRGSGPFSPKPYRALMHVRPRVMYPFLVYQRPSENKGDVSLGFGGGVGVEWTDPLKTWTAHTSGYYQHGTFWGRVAVQSGHTIARPSLDVFRAPSTVSVLMRDADGSADTLRVGRDERGIGAGVQTPIVLSSNVFQTHAQVSFRAEYRQERLFGRGGEGVRAADDRITLNPTIQFVLHRQKNTRDVVPNSGLFLTATSRADVWAARGRGSRWLRADSRLHIPLLHGTNTGVQVHGRLVAQNRGGVIDLTTIFPRGYETSEAFLGRGTFATYGLEITQPLLFVDDGLFLIPIYLKAVFAYGFAESMQGVSVGSQTERLSVAGAGLGLQLRFAHSIDFTLRFAPVYKFAGGEWDWTLR